MNISKLRKNLEERLDGLKKEYNVHSRAAIFNKPFESNHERNEINRLLVTLELKAQIKEVERVLMLIE